jgi:hypothetical protein
MHPTFIFMQDNFTLQCKGRAIVLNRLREMTHPNDNTYLLEDLNTWITWLSSLPIAAFQWPITSSIMLTYITYLPDSLSLQQLWYYFLNCVYPNPPCQLSLWEETHDFQQSVDTLFSHESTHLPPPHDPPWPLIFDRFPNIKWWCVLGLSWTVCRYSARSENENQHGSLFS